MSAPAEVELYSQQQNWVVVSNIFYFHPYLGKIPILTNIFQLGWNHQLENMCVSCRQLLHSKTADLWNQRKLRLVSHGLLMRIFCMVYFHWTVEEFEEVWNPGNCEVWALETLRWIKEVSVSWFFFGLQTVFWSFEGGYFFKMIFLGKTWLEM